MGPFQNQRVLAIFFGFALLLVFLGFAWLYWLPDPHYYYDQVQVGMQITEVEAIFGHPVQVFSDPLIDGVPFQTLPDPNGQTTTIKTLKRWWYDDNHLFEVRCDERGIVLEKTGPFVHPRQSFIKWVQLPFQK